KRAGIVLFNQMIGLTDPRAKCIVDGSVFSRETGGVTMELSGAEITIRCLQEEGVEYVFGYPGGAVLFIYDELFKQDKVKHVLVRHEQGAVHAADGYSRSSNKI